MKLRVLRENRNLWLLTCFTIYAVFFFIFAGIYFGIFKANPRNFLFNADVAKEQALPFTSPLENEISDLQAALQEYRAFLNRLDQSNELPPEDEQSKRLGIEEENYVGFFTGSSSEKRYLMLRLGKRMPYRIYMVGLSDELKGTDKVEFLRKYVAIVMTEGETLLKDKASVITSKPAIHDHFKTGHRDRRPGLGGFYAPDSLLSMRF